MKKTIITSLLALCTLCSQAQETKNDSTIIEGIINNIPDETRYHASNKS